MDELARGVWQLRGRPRHLMNVYLLGDVVIDGGARLSTRRILRPDASPCHVRQAWVDAKRTPPVREKDALHLRAWRHAR